MRHIAGQALLGSDQRFDPFSHHVEILRKYRKLVSPVPNLVADARS
jgi:hypothetical protein